MENRSIDIKEQNLLRLALKCRLISSEQEKKILSYYIGQKEQHPDISMVRIFKDHDFLSDEQISFLFAVKNHLQMKMLDKRFGELGIANKFIEPENVKKALKQQNEIFKKTRESVLIGDILLEKNEISKANKAAILLTQDRIEDEFLAASFNDIASTEMERLNINMRFGAIAVKKGLVSLAQLNQALKIQKAQNDKMREKVYLGQILQEQFGLSDANLTKILRTQKELEKQRLALEKALSLYNRENQLGKGLSRFFGYRFSKNKLSAFITVKKNVPENLTVSGFLAWLKTIGITYGICGEQEIQKILKTAAVGNEFKVAQGKAPVNPVDGTAEIFFDTSQKPTSKEDSNQTAHGFVKKGDVLARILPAKAGVAGKNVCGFTIAPPEGQMVHLSTGAGVTKKGNLCIADIDGRPTLFKGRTLFVKHADFSYPTRYLSGNISGELGEEYLDCNLKVEGDIGPDALVQCHDIVVDGDVRGRIHASGKVQIHGCVEYRMDQAEEMRTIRSDDEIYINRKIVNAVIMSSKRLIALNSDLISSKVYAFDEIMLKNVYTQGHAPAFLQVGKNPNPELRAINEAVKIKKKRLQKLLHKTELGEIERWFDGKIQIQNSYLEQQVILQHLLKQMDNKAVMQLPGAQKRAAAVLKDLKSASEKTDADPMNWHAAESFLYDFFTDLEKIRPDAGKAHLLKIIDMKYRMYKASVNTTKRYKNEYKVRKELVMKKVGKNADEIKRLRLEVDGLLVKKDYLKLNKAGRASSANAFIRVKNQVGAGTLIKVCASTLVVEPTVYGVKFSKKQKKDGPGPDIIIEGLYE
ncbi:flagellar assembly protein A [Desulfobacter curvatus]|uniref:flagellar assembly protein A n=1 Tax=Desulfobacter curvatus TaxID=2290 RepID=UPI00037F0FA0|nr:flagellar assembly protein A [Desulfobacter curvatus]